MVQAIWHVKRCGCCSFLSKKIMCKSRVINTQFCCLLDFPKAGLHSPKMGLIWNSLL